MNTVQIQAFLNLLLSIDITYVSYVIIILKLINRHQAVHEIKKEKRYYLLFGIVKFYYYPAINCYDNCKKSRRVEVIIIGIFVNGQASNETF